jgi:hypothetical protein
MEDDGKVLSLVTTAFWDAGEYLATADPWEDVMANGVNLISDELIEDRETSMAGFQTSYGMSPAQVAFARSVFERKLARPATTIELTPAEVQWLALTFEDPKARAAENIRWAVEHGQPVADLKWPESLDSTAEAQKAMQLCRESFAAMGILMP